MNERRLTLQEIEAEPTMSEGERQFVLKLLRLKPQLYAVRQDDGQVAIVGIKLNDKGRAYLEKGRRMLMEEGNGG